MTNTETALTVVESQAVEEVSLAEALHIDKTFTAPTLRRGGDGDAAPRTLSWLTGNNPMFAANGKTPLPAARGFFIDKPDEDEMYLADYELMDAMEALCEQDRAREVQIEHYDEANKPVKVPSWELYGPSLFVVCEGVPSRYEMERDSSDRWGIAYGWPKDEGGRSKLRFHCFIKELMDAGYNGAFVASFNSFCTTKAIQALREQNAVLELADKLRGKAGEVDPVPYYAYALPLKCSVKTLTASSDKGSREVYYPVPAIPRLPKRDPAAVMAYLASMAITDEQATILEANGRVEQAVEWSIKESARIISGNEEDAPAIEAPLADVAPPF